MSRTYKDYKKNYTKMVHLSKKWRHRVLKLTKDLFRERRKTLKGEDNGRALKYSASDRWFFD